MEEGREGEKIGRMASKYLTLTLTQPARTTGCIMSQLSIGSSSTTLDTGVYFDSCERFSEVLGAAEAEGAAHWTAEHISQALAWASHIQQACRGPSHAC